jgi:hypothetical protein
MFQALGERHRSVTPNFFSWAPWIGVWRVCSRGKSLPIQGPGGVEILALRVTIKDAAIRPDAFDV